MQLFCVIMSWSLVVSGHRKRARGHLCVSLTVGLLALQNSISFFSNNQ